MFVDPAAQYTLAPEINTALKENTYSPFGFNGLGETIFYTRYSRLKDNGEQERWNDVTKRNIEGSMTLWANALLQRTQSFNPRASFQFSDGWVAQYFEYFYSMKFTAPGRGLWAQGTPYVFERGSAALNNCAYTSAGNIAYDAAWAMDMLMCGIGVGFDTRFVKPSLEVYEPLDSSVRLFVVPDSREGWAESVRVLLESYLLPGRSRVQFDYSQVRPAGSPIRGFGGTASGHQPLEKLHDRIRHYCANARRDFIQLQFIDTTRFVTDIMNAIGGCVVAGNVRRSAEIALGRADDNTFLNLKNYEMYPERQEIGWMSNNTVVIENARDYTMLDYITERIIDNGEPGIADLNLIQNHGRYGELKPDNAVGLNPCGETPLKNYELCCLSEIYLPNCHTVTEFHRACQFANFYAFAVSMLPTHCPDTNAVIEDNHRIGVSVTGVAEFADKFGDDELEMWLRSGYNVIQRSNREMAKTIGVKPSIRTTVVKPSGTVSLLAGMSPGMHWPTFTKAVRRVRMSKDSAMVPALVEANIPYEDDQYSDNTFVFEFPIAHNSHTRAAKQVSLREQIERLALMQSAWADNAVSCTLYFDPEKEAKLIPGLVREFAGRIKSWSFLPHTEDGVFAQAPYTGCSDEEYARRVNDIQAIDWTRVIAAGTSDGEDTRFCDGDSCDITLPPAV